MNKKITMPQDIYDKFSKDAMAVGISSLIADKNEILATYSYGKRSIEKNLDTTCDTIYRIASISKVEVAIAALMLYDEGRLDLTCDISKYLGFKVRNPYFPNDIITTEMLMTQTSSINDCEDQGIGYDLVNGPKYFVDLERLLNDETYEYYTPKTYLKVHPGSTFCYSNFGCGILACIVEKISGMYFTDFIKERLFKPLGIDGGFRIDDVKALDKVASLYNETDLSLVRDSEIFQKVVFPRYPIGHNFRGPAGGLFISMLDLCKIMQMLMNKGTYQNKVYLKKETVENMQKIHWKTLYPDGLYKQKGLQLLILDDYGKTLYGHTGCAYGLRSYMLFNDEYGYIFLCNGAKYKMARDGFSKVQEDFLKEQLHETSHH